MPAATISGVTNPPAGTLQLPHYGNHWVLEPGQAVREAGTVSGEALLALPLPLEALLLRLQALRRSVLRAPPALAAHPKNCSGT